MVQKKKVVSKKKAVSKKTAAKTAATDTAGEEEDGEGEAEEATPRKPRAPREDYGYRPGATVEVLEEKEYRGKRGELFDLLRKNDGKPVEKFIEKAQELLGDDPARGWLRFFVKDGAVALQGGDEE